MPRPGPRMELVPVRLPDALLDPIDAIAAALADPDEEPNRSEVIRDLLTEALRGRRGAA